MKNLFRTVCLLFVCTLMIQTVAYAQSETKKSEETVVVLKSGSKLQGKLISYDPNTEVEIEILGRLLTLPSSEVKRIVMPTSSRNINISRIQTKKIYHRTNVGILSNDNGNGISLNYSALYQHSRWLAVGLGAGIDNYYFQRGRNVYPIFTEIKSYLVDGNSSPYVSLKSGYGFIATNAEENQTNTKGGMIINPTFGYRLGSSGVFMDFYIGFRFQSAEYEVNNGWSKSHQDIQWNRIETGIGISF